MEDTLPTWRKALPASTTALLTCLLCTLPYLATTKSDTKHLEVLVDITRTDVGRGQGHCTKRVTAIIRFPLEKVTLNLALSEQFSSRDIPVYTSEGKGWTLAPKDNRNNTEIPCFYQDIDQDAAISITFSGELYIIRGVFHTLSGSFTISPGRAGAGRRHSINYQKNHASYTPYMHHQQRIKRQANVKKTYTVEILLVTDFPLYKRWLALSSEEQIFARDREVVTMMKYYFTHIIHEVDLRYRSIQETDYSISIVLSGIYIAKSAGSLRWEEDLTESQVSSPNRSSRGLLSNDALSGLSTWAAQTTSNLHYDHVMLFTGYDLYHWELVGGVRTKQYNKIGTAFLDGICHLRTRVSVVEDLGNFISALTAAHELGHNLGARHDGSRNTCSSANQFVMASTVESETDGNIFRFSRCSINSFRSKLAVSNRLNRNCLANTGQWYNKTAVDKNLATLPGVTFSITNQCQLIYGAKSYFCGSQSNVENICTKLACYIPKRKACYIIHGKGAFRGTVCGNKKWCDGGKCVYSPNAPVSPENCTFGDGNTTVSLNGEQLSCAYLVARHPYLCYDASVKDLCCGSCLNIHKPDRQGCEYGNKLSGCESQTRLGCYYDSGPCCETCHQYKTNIQDCQFGDKIGQCHTGICATANYQDACCQTCHVTTPPSKTTSTTPPTTRTTHRTTTTTTSPAQVSANRPESAGESTAPSESNLHTDDTNIKDSSGVESMLLRSKTMLVCLIAVLTLCAQQQRLFL